MGSKFGIFIPLMSLMICSSLIGDVKSKAVSTRHRETRGVLSPTKDRSVFSVLNDVLTLVSDMDSLVHLIKDGKSEETFRKNVMKKLDDIREMIKKVDSVPISNEELSVKKIKMINNVFNEGFDKLWEQLKNDHDYHNKSANEYVLQDDDLRNLKTNLENILVVKKQIKEGDHYRSIPQNNFEYHIEISGVKLSGPVICDEISRLDETHNYYKTILAIISKGYTMLLLSWQNRKMTSNDTEFCQKNQEIILESYKNNVTELTKSAKFHMEQVKDSSYRATFSCDPKQWKEGITYASFNRIELDHKKCDLGVDKTSNDFCDEDRNSDPDLSIRRISLHPQSCRTDTNEVMTSARFHEEKGIVRIEVQCGTIIDGEIDPKSLRWDTFDRRYGRQQLPNALLTWKLRSFNLDDIALPDDELLTGVKFEVVDDHFISLVVQGSKIYNYTKGTKVGESSWHYPVQNSEKSRENIDISYLTRPVTLTKQTKEVSDPGRNYINLTVSQWSDEFGNEAIVPFFDTTPHFASPVSPLGGLGLFYKSYPGYAGFFALKHLTPRYIHFI